MNLSEIEDALTAFAPFLQPAGRLEVIGAGFSSVVYATQSGWIVRAPLTPAAAARQIREATVLPTLAARLPIAIPHPQRALPPCEAAPFGAFAYPRLPGRLMERADFDPFIDTRIAEDLADAFAALHAIAPNEVGLSVPRIGQGYFTELWRAVRPFLPSSGLTEAELTSISAWWSSFLVGETMSDQTLCLTHGDAWWENLTVSENRLAGLLDWESLAISDPARDLAVTLEMGGGFFARVIERYRRASGRDDPQLERRARKLFVTRQFEGARIAAERQDESEWPDVLNKLRASEIFSRGADA